MQLRQVDLRSVGHSNQKLSQKIDFREFHQVNPLEHLKWVAIWNLWVYKFEEKNSCSLVLPKGARMQHIEVEIKKTLVQSILEPLQSAKISSQILSL